MSDEIEKVAVSKDDLAAVVQAMPDGKGVLLGNSEGGEKFEDICEHRISSVSVEQLKELAADPNLFHVVTMMMRAGAAFYMNYLEYTYFSPTSNQNDSFQYRIFKWGGLPWNIATVPIGSKEACFESAKATNMRLANGVPCVIGAAPRVAVATPPRGTWLDEPECQFFPLNSERVWTLENDKSSPIYQQGGFQDATIEESLYLERLHAEHRKKFG